MVKGFAEQAGGGIAIDSTFGKGTKVTVWLPASNAAAPTPPVRQASVPLVALSGRVLFVDDEQMVRETLAEGLVDQGFSVLIAGSGAEALALIDADEVFDVLVTDYAMPSMDGLTLIRQARERRPDLPALILTGYVEQVGLDGGDLSLASVLSILRKPIGAEQLAAAIRAAVTLSRNGSHVL
jgi:CheY-like chemotaxis protein